MNFYLRSSILSVTFMRVRSLFVRIFLLGFSVENTSRSITSFGLTKTGKFHLSRRHGNYASRMYLSSVTLQPRAIGYICY